MERVEMQGVREYCEEYAVSLMESENGRVVVQGLNEGGYNSVKIDLLDLIAWLRANRPDLLEA